MHTLLFIVQRYELLFNYPSFVSAKKQKSLSFWRGFYVCLKIRWNYFPWFSSETVSFLRPFARRDANTRRPFFVAILSRKPCLFTLLLLCGWNVLFIVLSILFVIIRRIRAAKLRNYFQPCKFFLKNYVLYIMKL